VSVTDDRLPYMPVYVGDFLSITATLSGEEAALYLLLLLYAWGSTEPLPGDPKQLAQIVRYPQKCFDRLWVRVSARFTVASGGLVDKSLEKRRAESLALRDQRRYGAQKTNEKRWGASNAEGSPSDSLSDSLSVSPPSQAKPDQSKSKTGASEGLAPVKAMFSEQGRKTRQTLILTPEHYKIIADAAPDADPLTVGRKYLEWIEREQIWPRDVNAHLRSFARQELINDVQLAKRKAADRAAGPKSIATILGRMPRFEPPP
jgi:uncharacterized protein YdaU (DUF1376 family)